MTARSIPTAPESFDNDDTSVLFNDLVAIRNVLLQFSRGDFDSDLSGRNVFVAALKALQANLRHLTWQVKEVSHGDFSLRVDFMGEFSTAFNSMVEQLDQTLTDLKTREAQLLTSEERWNLAIQCSSDGIWDINIDQQTAWYSDSFMTMMGYVPEDLPPNLSWETKIHPDDRVQDALIAMLMTLRGIGDLLPFSVECRLRKRQEEYLWVRLRGMPVRSGSVRRLIAVASDITAQKETEKTLIHKAMYDNLTGLPNRYLLNDRLKHLVADSQRHGTPFVFATLDLDFFKTINDTHGHAAGDQVLMELAKRLSTGLRNTDTAARLGGDEFVAVYPCEAGTEQKTAATVMERFYHELRKPLVLGEDKEYQLRSSVGIAFFPRHAQDLPTLFERADAALYKAKRNGKNQYAIYDLGDPSASK
ncbi:MAG: sensor domain-containing diguanylate cyclase [Phycisphaerales bacterium]|nr:sensor domain-containing diguanylate cyclase [Phycisphaerales bacterium]